MVAETARPSALAFVLDHRPYRFELCERPLELSPELTVRYWWMDARQLRTATAAEEADVPNRRSCTDLWWHLADIAGVSQEVNCQNNYLLARMYSQQANARGAQDFYRDARLFPGAVHCRVDHETASHACADLANPLAVLGSLDVFLRENSVPTTDQTNVCDRIDDLLRPGRIGLQSGRNDRLQDYLADVARQISRARRRGTDVNRWWPNALAHWSKICFFTCYSQAWTAIREWLLLTGRIDERSAEFLRYWHFQNWGVGHNYGGVPLVLGGLPLAVHPISGYLMQQPDLRQTVAGFFGEVTPGEPDEVVAQRASYWRWTQAIVEAAQRYRVQWDEAQLRRVRHCDQPQNWDGPVQARCRAGRSSSASVRGPRRRSSRTAD